MPRILFLCVANSARSQMAEGLAKTLAPRGWSVQSAGSAPTTVNPFAVAAMRELGIDIAHHDSKSLESLDLEAVDTIVTLCAEEICPAVSSSRRVIRLHWPFEDPAAESGTREEKLVAFRRVRDQIKARLELFFGERS